MVAIKTIIGIFIILPLLFLLIFFVFPVYNQFLVSSFPHYPNAQSWKTEFIEGNGLDNSSFISISFTTIDSPETITKYYRTELDKKGWIENWTNKGTSNNSLSDPKRLTYNEPSSYDPSVKYVPALFFNKKFLSRRASIDLSLVNPDKVSETKYPSFTRVVIILH